MNYLTANTFMATFIYRCIWHEFPVRHIFKISMSCPEYRHENLGKLNKRMVSHKNERCGSRIVWIMLLRYPIVLWKIECNLTETPRQGSSWIVFIQFGIVLLFDNMMNFWLKRTLVEVFCDIRKSNNIIYTNYFAVNAILYLFYFIGQMIDWIWRGRPVCCVIHTPHMQKIARAGLAFFFPVSGPHKKSPTRTHTTYSCVRSISR